MSDLQAVRDALELIDREVWIVTAAAGERRGGLVATWVSEGTIDREHPAMVIALASNHYTAELVDASSAFALHLLTPGELSLAWNFALGSGRHRDKLSGLALRSGQTGSPILSDCLAWFDCRVFARLEGGDRIYYWADVLAGGRNRSERPLRQSELLAAAEPGQRQQLIADLQRDIQIQRPLMQGWRSDLPPLLRPRPESRHEAC